MGVDDVHNNNNNNHNHMYLALLVFIFFLPSRGASLQVRVKPSPVFFWGWWWWCWVMVVIRGWRMRDWFIASGRGPREGGRKTQINKTSRIHPHACTCIYMHARPPRSPGLGSLFSNPFPPHAALTVSWRPPVAAVVGVGSCVCVCVCVCVCARARACACVCVCLIGVLGC